MRAMRRLNVGHGKWSGSLVRLALAGGVGGLLSCKSDGPTALAVSNLRFVTQPPSLVTAGQPFSVSVELLTSAGQRAAGAHDQVSITDVGGATLSGPAMVAAVSGLAVFTGLMFTEAVPNVQLDATDGGLTAASATIGIKPGPAATQQSSVIPSPGNIQPNVATNLTFTFKDAYGNVLANLPVSVSSSLAGSTFTPSSGSTTASGTFLTSFKSSGTGSAAVTAIVNGTTVSFATPYVFVDLCPPAPLTLPGTLNGHLPAGACVIGGNPAAAYRFSVPPGPSIVAAFTISSDFVPIVEVTADPPADNIMLQGTVQNTVTADWLLPAGTYQFHMASNGTGAFAVADSVVPGNTGCRERHLAVGGSYTGQALAAGDCVLAVDTSFYDVFSMQSARPCTVALQSATLRLALILVDPNDASGHPNAFAEADGSATGADAQISMQSCMGPHGYFWIVANTFGQASGAYTLVLTFTGPAAARADERAARAAIVRGASAPLAPSVDPVRNLLRRRLN